MKDHPEQADAAVEPTVEAEHGGKAEEGAAELLALMLTSDPGVDTVAAAPAERVDGVIIGVLVDLTAEGEPRVSFGESLAEGPLVARSTVALSGDDVGCELALLFEAGDLRRPIVMGRMHRPTPAQPPVDAEAASELETTVDGKRITFRAAEQIELRCGKASITLTRAGKILIRGAYLLNRSSGVNRILGGSVQIN